MLKKSLFSKIFLLFVLISSVIGAFILTITLQQRTRDLEEALVQENKLLANTISTTIEATHLVQVLPFTILKEVADSENVIFLWIVNPKGEIFYADDPEMFGKIIDDPSLGTNQLVIKDIVYPKNGEKIKLFVSPLKLEAGQKPWSLYMGISLKAIRSAQKEMIFSGLIFFGLIIIATIFASFYLAKGITGPLETLRKGAEIIGKGNLDYQIELKTGDELEELAKSFNQMAKNLKEFHTALEEAKTVLEIKVAARTRELRELAESLEEKVKEKTKELQEKIKELERFQKIAVGRELKMVELKKEIQRLKKILESYQKEKYD